MLRSAALVARRGMQPLRHLTTSTELGFTPYPARAEFARKHLAPGVGRATDLEFVRGQGSWLIASTGQRYLDFASGIAVTSLGHAHPRVVEAVQKQAALLIHAQVNIAWHKPQLDLVERLLTIVPPAIKNPKFFFWNSGAEAIEASMKLARHATKKNNIIVFQGGYHGRTVGTMSLTTSKTIYRAGFGPLMPGVFVAPFAYCHHCACTRYSSELGPSNCCGEPFRQLELLLKQQTAPSETAAIIIEPVLGEGGYVPAPPKFWQQLRKLCTDNNILMIADEVQTGFARTGAWFASERLGATPDILVFAKAVANGMPLSGIVSDGALMDTQPPGSMGGTFACNAVSCASAIATIDTMREENIMENVHHRAAQLWAGLEELKSKRRLISDVRGLGLMIGVEFDHTHFKPGTATAIAKRCLERNMVMLTSGAFECIRFMPPLNVSQEEVALALDIFSQSVADVEASHAL